MTGYLTEKSYVYSFGVVLVELLTGVKPGFRIAMASNESVSIIQHFLSSIENNSWRQILCFDVADESEMEEIEIVAELVKKCLSRSGINRPTMEQVLKELKSLKKVPDNLWAQENSEKTEHLLGDQSSTYVTAMIEPDAQTVVSFEIEDHRC